MSKVSCMKHKLLRLGMGVKDYINDPNKVLKRVVWFGGEHQHILVKRVLLPDPQILTGKKKEIKKCASTEDFYVWELLAQDIYGSFSLNSDILVPA